MNVLGNERLQILQSEWAESFPLTDCDEQRDVKWRCSQGHEWITKLFYRIKGVNCPECCISALKVDNPRVTKIVIGNQTFLSFWDWEKNTGVDPSKLSISSRKSVHWRCTNGHVWHKTIHLQRQVNHCVECSKKEKQRETSYIKKTVINNSELMAFWDKDKNKDLGLDPSTLTSGSEKVAYWICENMHSWKKRFANNSSLPAALRVKNNINMRYFRIKW